jgi:hypothetical protein
MVLPPEKRLNFFVYIIESPSSEDVYNDISEGRRIKELLELQNIPVVLRTVVDYKMYTRAILPDILQAMSMSPFKDKLTILHISAHGNDMGIRLTDNRDIRWDELRSILVLINKIMKNRLFLCMSCCKGYSAIQMSMKPDSLDHPCFAFITHTGSPTWSESAIGFASLYHNISKGYTVLEAVTRMNAASGMEEKNNESKFISVTSEEIRKGYIEYLYELNASEIREGIRESNTKQSQSLLS